MAADMVARGHVCPPRFLRGWPWRRALDAPLTVSHLAMTSALWREPAADVVAWYARRIAVPSGHPRLRIRVSSEAGRGRYAARWQPGRSIARVIPPLCANCGRALAGRKRKFCGAECIADYYNARGIKTGPAVIASAQARAARKAGSNIPGLSG